MSGVTPFTKIPYTRLRYVYSKDPEKITKFCRAIEKRVQIYNVVFAEGSWYLWFVPDDTKTDVKSGNLDA